MFKLKFALLGLVLSISLLACQNANISVTGMLNQLGLGGGPLAPNPFTITSNTPLFVNSSIAGTVVLVGSPISIAGVGATPLGATISGGGLSLPLTAPTYADGPLPTGAVQFAAAFNPEQAYTATITVNATWPTGANPGCIVQGVFSAVSCLMPTFTITSTQISTAGTGNLVVKGYATNGGPNDFTLSNSIRSTVFGYRMIASINALSNSDNINSLVPYNGKLYVLTDTNGGLFSYQDTGAFTKLAPNNVGYLSSLSGVGLVCGTAPSASSGRIYFPGQSVGGGYKLMYWEDSTATGGILSNTSGSAAVSDSITNLTCYNGNIFFAAKNAGGLIKLYKFDTNSMVLSQLGSTNALAASDALRWAAGNPQPPFTIYNHPVLGHPVLVYASANPSGQEKLWYYDDFTANYFQISNTAGNLVSDQVSDYVPMQYSGSLYFFANYLSSTQTQKMMKYDPTQAVVNQLTQVSNVCPGCGNEDAPFNAFPFVSLNGSLFSYLQSDLGPSNGFKIYKYFPASSPNWKMITSTTANGNNDIPYYGPVSYPKTTIVYNNKLFFTAVDPSGNFKFYVYDDVLGSVQQLTNLYSGGNEVDISGANQFDPLFTIYNNRLYFRAYIASGIAKWLVYDDNTKVLAIAANIGGNACNNINWTRTVQPVVYAGKLFITALSCGQGDKLYGLCDTATGCVP